MSIIPALKDYFVMLYDAQVSKDVISHLPVLKEISVPSNPVFNVFGVTDISFNTWMQFYPGYLFSSIKSLFCFCFSFQWLSYFPNIVPKIQSSILNETSVLDHSFLGILTVLEIPTLEDNKLFIGFLNSFFLSLPISFAHCITLRRFLMFGYWQGFYSALGTIVGQLCFTVSIIFGFRSLIITWFSFPLLTLLVGGFVTTKIFLEAYSNRYFDIEITKTKKYLKNYFFLNLVISWTEQTSLFRYFGNLTFSPEPNALDTFFSHTETDFFISNAYYIIGLLFGSLFFTGLFGFVLGSLQDYIYDYYYLNSYGSWRRKVHLFFKRLIVGAFLVSSPVKYYSYDYFLTGPLGYVYDDFNLNKSALSLSKVKNRNHSPFLVYEKNGTYCKNLQPFDHVKNLRYDWHNLSFETINMFTEYRSLRQYFYHPYARLLWTNIGRKGYRLMIELRERFDLNYKHDVAKIRLDRRFENQNQSFVNKKEETIFYKTLEINHKKPGKKNLISPSFKKSLSVLNRNKKENKDIYHSLFTVNHLTPSGKILSDNQKFFEEKVHKNLLKSDNFDYSKSDSFDFSKSDSFNTSKSNNFDTVFNMLYVYNINAFIKINSVNFIEAYMETLLDFAVKLDEKFNPWNNEDFNLHNKKRGKPINTKILERFTYEKRVGKKANPVEKKIDEETNLFNDPKLFPKIKAVGTKQAVSLSLRCKEILTPILERFTYVNKKANPVEKKIDEETNLFNDPKLFPKIKEILTLTKDPNFSDLKAISNFSTFTDTDDSIFIDSRDLDGFPHSLFGGLGRTTAFFEFSNTFRYPESKIYSYYRHAHAFRVYRPIMVRQFNYHKMIKFGFDFFYQNQPTFQTLTTDEEERLFQKRLVLGQYYDGFRFYNQLPYIKSFQNLYKTSKSESAQIFNHQFKGTNYVLRAQFALTEGRTEVKEKYPVLKFDQPLYLPNTLTNYKNLKPFHEELSQEKPRKIFLEISNSTPFYAGWDQGLRKLVLTNRLLPRSLAGYGLYLPKDESSRDQRLILTSDEKINEIIEKPIKKDDASLLNLKKSLKKEIEFTTWPIPLSVLETEKYAKIYSNLLSEPNNSVNINNQWDPLAVKEDILYVKQDLLPNIRVYDHFLQRRVEEYLYPLFSGKDKKSLPSLASETFKLIFKLLENLAKKPYILYPYISSNMSRSFGDFFFFNFEVFKIKLPFSENNDDFTEKIKMPFSENNDDFTEKIRNGVVNNEDSEYKEIRELHYGLLYRKFYDKNGVFRGGVSGINEHKHETRARPPINKRQKNQLLFEKNKENGFSFFQPSYPFLPLNFQLYKNQGRGMLEEYYKKDSVNRITMLRVNDRLQNDVFFRVMHSPMQFTTKGTFIWPGNFVTKSFKVTKFTNMFYLESIKVLFRRVLRNWPWWVRAGTFVTTWVLILYFDYRSVSDEERERRERYYRRYGKHWYE